MRGSDPDAALYYLARMLDAGEDPLYLARRIVRMAIEDIGLADPQAVVQALAAKDVFDFLGSPEGELALAQAVIYLATAPKSNAAYVAFGAALESAKQHGSLAPPNAQPVPPAEHLTANSAGNAVILSAVQAEPNKPPAAYQRFFALGFDVANGKNRWKEASPPK